MATIDASFSIVFSRCPLNSSNPLLHISSPPRTCIKYPLAPLSSLQIYPIDRKPRFRVCSSVVENVVLEEKEEETQKINQKRKLFVLNLPWSLSVGDIKTLFGECGTVVDVEIIKQQDGKSRGFAFITMATGEEAQAAVDKLDSREVSGRIIRVEFAKRLKKPPKAPPKDPTPAETRHKLYSSNLAWKVRSSHLREFFSAFNPLSVRVVFDAPSGKSGGYGFVSFSTKDEAEAALTALDGKELLGRPVRLRFGERNTDKSQSEDSSEINVAESETETETEGKTEEKLEDS